MIGYRNWYENSIHESASNCIRSQPCGKSGTPKTVFEMSNLSDQEKPWKVV